MRRPTNITIACVVILLIAIICVFAFSGNKKQVANNVQNVTTQSNNEIANNEVSENAQNEIENTVVEEPAENEVENVEEQTETFTETPETAEEKAIGIVRNDWKGENATFSVNGMDSSGNYIVQVTDRNTVVLAFYTVNVGDGSFTKREMN